jgi:murein DD-endopeptidase MepM/ murein hydrolase activator NlpD
MRFFLGLLTIALFFLACDKKNPNPLVDLKGFTYYPAGKLAPAKSGSGRLGDNYVYAPGIRFPIESGEAYINSQVYGKGGYLGARGSLCAKENYSYPWRDNYCEKRSKYSMPLCSAGTGHQGVDIRTATCEKKKYYAVAVEEGIVTYIGKYTVKLRGNSGRTYRYLHLDSRTLKVRRGQRLERGQRMGLVSNNMGSTPTSIHLHFDMKQTIKVGNTSKSVFVPPYTSLVEAYKRLLSGRP